MGKKADAAAITKAYRKLAKKKHPDKGGDPEEFKMLAEAYEVMTLLVSRCRVFLPPLTRHRASSDCYLNHLFAGVISLTVLVYMYTRLARPNFQARTGTGKHSFSLFS